MAVAEIHGKSPNSASEDQLTGNVLGALRYLPADKGIVGFLRSVEGLSAHIPAPDGASAATVHFWPQGRTREPDGLIELSIGQRLFHIVVEAKYHSGASDWELSEETPDDEEEPILVGNQLTDQWRDLVLGEYMVWQGWQRVLPLRLTSRPEDRFLLYLTAHPVRPQDELARSVALSPELSGRLFWASWYDVYAYLQQRRESLAAFPYCLVIEDLLTLLARKQFTTFSGVAPPPEIEVAARDARFWAGP